MFKHSESEIDAIRELLKIEHADAYAVDQDHMDLLEELWDEFLDGYARPALDAHIVAPFMDPEWDDAKDKLCWYFEDCWYNNLTGNTQLVPKVCEYFISLLDAAGVKHEELTPEGTIIFYPPHL